MHTYKVSLFKYVVLYRRPAFAVLFRAYSKFILAKIKILNGRGSGQSRAPSRSTSLDKSLLGQALLLNLPLIYGLHPTKVTVKVPPKTTSKPDSNSTDGALKVTETPELTTPADVISCDASYVPASIEIAFTASTAGQQPVGSVNTTGLPV